ncbi:CGNR zinc finger domain-containing protein [Streptomyces sp. NBC_00233]|uniref:CGNR zinc finger domain-containing protein n=1 Tax=Streptomyces sp. NBC_00233 TaxID=2975686 RepID=UPI002258C160|nr:CGNR zinc finger domain-containing protein [Streptomyces sp. NBC_00233]MCX5231111.1 CGNR zinc finger domain-containing protein [Streptomyces sp. NBC_00233]
MHRLERCAEHTCGRVSWDTSKNHSRRWCSMRVCGNRTKSRRYAAPGSATERLRCRGARRDISWRTRAVLPGAEAPPCS